MKLFEPKIPPINPVPGEISPGMKINKSDKVRVGEVYIKPRIIGGLLENATFRTAANGARVEIFPNDDTTIGIISYDANSNPVFTTKIYGDDIGDVILGSIDEGKYVQWDASTATLVINGVSLVDFVATTVATGSDLALMDWTSSLIFSASDKDTVAWTSGNIRFTNGEVFAIGAGNTGNMTLTTYLIFNRSAPTVVGITTDPAGTIGANIVQLGVASPNASSNHKAKYQIYSGDGGANISVDNIVGNDSSSNEFVSATAEIKDAIITYAKIQNVTDARLLGRSAGMVGAMGEITVGTGLSLSGGSLTSSITQYTDEMAQDAIGNNVGAGLSYNDTSGAVSCTITQYTDELAEDAIGGILTDTDTIDLTYNDGANTITADVKLTAMVTKLSTTGSINAKTIATTNLYTVPTGKTAIITMAVIRVTVADTITVVPTLGIGVAAGEADIFGSTALTGLDATTKIYTFNASGQYVNVAADGVIKLGIDVGATATTMTIAVDLFGYLI